MHWPQYTWIGIASFNLVMSYRLDGQPRKGEHRLPIDVIGTALSLLLLFYGGFFSQP